jgi:hypothetical protein
MKVSELIEQLSKLDPNKEVMYEHYEGESEIRRLYETEVTIPNITHLPNNKYDVKMNKLDVVMLTCYRDDI